MFEIDYLESQPVAERVRAQRNCAKLPEAIGDYHTDPFSIC